VTFCVYEKTLTVHPWRLRNFHRRVQFPHGQKDDTRGHRGANAQRLRVARREDRQTG
jgi:hypothetical protein